MLKSIRQLIMSLRVFLAIKQYCKQKKIYCKINSLFNTIKISRNFSSLYFIIVLKFAPDDCSVFYKLEYIQRGILE